LRLGLQRLYPANTPAEVAGGKGKLLRYWYSEDPRFHPDTDYKELEQVLQEMKLRKNGTRSKAGNKPPKEGKGKNDGSGSGRKNKRTRDDVESEQQQPFQQYPQQQYQLAGEPVPPISEPHYTMNSIPILSFTSEGSNNNNNNTFTEAPQDISLSSAFLGSLSPQSQLSSSHVTADREDLATTIHPVLPSKRSRNEQSESQATTSPQLLLYKIGKNNEKVQQIYCEHNAVFVRETKHDQEVTPSEGDKDQPQRVELSMDTAYSRNGQAQLLFSPDNQRFYIRVLHKNGVELIKGEGGGGGSSSSTFLPEGQKAELSEGMCIRFPGTSNTYVEFQVGGITNLSELPTMTVSRFHLVMVRPKNKIVNPEHIPAEDEFEEVESWPLTQKLVAGRSQTASIYLSSPYVSRNQFAIWTEEGQSSSGDASKMVVKLVDLSSTTGTFVRVGKQMLEKNKPVVLESGTVFSVCGQYYFRLSQLY
jgi:hypothetical protein